MSVIRCIERSKRKWPWSHWVTAGTKMTAVKKMTTVRLSDRGHRIDHGQILWPRSKRWSRSDWVTAVKRMATVRLCDRGHRIDHGQTQWPRSQYWPRSIERQRSKKWPRSYWGAGSTKSTTVKFSDRGHKNTRLHMEHPPSQKFPWWNWVAMLTRAATMKSTGSGKKKKIRDHIELSGSGQQIDRGQVDGLRSQNVGCQVEWKRSKWIATVSLIDCRHKFKRIQITWMGSKEWPQSNRVTEVKKVAMVTLNARGCKNHHDKVVWPQLRNDRGKIEWTWSEKESAMVGLISGGRKVGRGHIDWAWSKIWPRSGWLAAVILNDRGQKFYYYGIEWLGSQEWPRSNWVSPAIRIYNVMSS